MNKLYIFIASLIGLLLGIGGTNLASTQFGALDVAQDLKDDKVAILSLYIYERARIGEIPVLDLSIGDTEEMSQAYVKAVLDKKIAEPQLDLFETLKDEALKRAEVCTTIII